MHYPKSKYKPCLNFLLEIKLLVIFVLFFAMTCGGQGYYCVLVLITYVNLFKTSFKKRRKKGDNIVFWDTSYAQCLKPEHISSKCLGRNFTHEAHRKNSKFHNA